MTITLWLLLTVPVVAEKVALLWPAGTDTLAGTVSAALLLLSDTGVIAAAAWFSDTVQVLEALLPRVDGVQERDVRFVCAGAVRLSVNGWEPPFRLAVTITFWLLLTVAVVAEKVALL